MYFSEKISQIEEKGPTLQHCSHHWYPVVIGNTMQAFVV